MKCQVPARARVLATPCTLGPRLLARDQVVQALALADLTVLLVRILAASTTSTIDHDRLGCARSVKHNRRQLHLRKNWTLYTKTEDHSLEIAVEVAVAFMHPRSKEGPLLGLMLENEEVQT